MNVKYFNDRVDLARTYMEDGAARTAAAKLRALADELEEEKRREDRWLDNMARSMRRRD